MDIIFESITEEPTEFVLPNGEVVINYGHVQLVSINESEL